MMAEEKYTGKKGQIRAGIKMEEGTWVGWGGGAQNSTVSVGK